MASCLLTWKNLTEIDHVKKKKKKKKKKLLPNFSKNKSNFIDQKRKKKKKGAKISHNDKIDLLGKKGEKKYFA